MPMAPANLVGAQKGAPVLPTKAEVNQGGGDNPLSIRKRKLLKKAQEVQSRLERLAQTRTLNINQKGSLNWAKSVINATNATTSAVKTANLKAKSVIGASSSTTSAVRTASENVKRIRSPDELLPSKKARSHNTNITGAITKPFSEVAKESLVMAVIDRSDVDGIIPKDKWGYVESATIGQCLTVLKEMPGTPPICDDAGWHRGGVKLLEFGNVRSVDLYKAALRRVGELWPGAQLELVKQSDIPTRPRAVAWVPEEPANASDILELLQVCNPELPTHDWRIGKIEEAEGAKRQIYVIITAETIPHLVRTKGKLRYGFRSVVLRPYKQDLAPTKEAVASTEVAAHAPGNVEQSKQLSTEAPTSPGKVSTEVPIPEGGNVPGEAGNVEASTSKAAGTPGSKNTDQLSVPITETSYTSSAKGAVGLLTASEREDADDDSDRTLVGVELNLSITNDGNNPTN